MNSAMLFSLDSKSTDTAPPPVLPIIDFSSFVDGDETERSRGASALVSALSQTGFVFLENHGLDEALVARMFSHSREFFASDLEAKERFAWKDAASNRGYVRMGREKLSDLDKEGRGKEIKMLKEVSPDMKEAFDIGFDGPDVDKNIYPSQEFGAFFESTFQTLHKLNVKLITNMLRLLHYPRVRELEINDRSRRCGAHTDYGSLTLLFQDEVGGLEILNQKTGEFVQVVPLPGTIVVNVGDLLQRWTNDFLPSVQHRVVKPYSVDKEGWLPSRYSIAYFCDPDFDVNVETIDKFVTAKNPRKYGIVNAGEYIISRLANSYA
ncbi:hypothetical protein BC830DRAFT_1132697 [Chytriomyces sp. MP71]|nr:hypothetical protein BC830DRAFT_1132697 [Chytriomyces sp. MP71]